MISFGGRGILLDIEGTTSSVRYVFDVMFPYVRQNVGSYLLEHWSSEETRSALRLMAADDGAGSLDAWWGHVDGSAQQQRQYVAERVARLMDQDAKTMGLKTLQGLVWRNGFRSRQLVAHVYDDVPQALQRWRGSGIDIRVYSSGSVEAQRLFFGHTRAGSLLPQFSGHYDTSIGPKRQAESYTKIARHWGLPAAEILFISDVLDELHAARSAGMQTALAVRPEADSPERLDEHPAIESLEQVQLARQPV